MKTLKAGDSTHAACEICQSFQKVTFRIRDVSVGTEGRVVREILSGVCDTCDSVIVLPNQSVTSINHQLESKLTKGKL